MMRSLCSRMRNSKTLCRRRSVFIMVFLIFQAFMFLLIQPEGMALNVNAQNSGGNVQVYEEGGIAPVEAGQNQAGQYQEQPQELGDIQFDEMTAIDLSNVPDEPENGSNYDIKIEIPVELTNLYAVVDMFRVVCKVGKASGYSQGDDMFEGSPETYYIYRQIVNRAWNGMVTFNINLPDNKTLNDMDRYICRLWVHNQERDRWYGVDICRTDCSDRAGIDHPWSVGNVGSDPISGGYIQ